MIPQSYIIDWSHSAPWSSPDQVEHDLVLSRAICELYSNPILSKELVFRGGTALHKLFFKNAGRFSEDLPMSGLMRCISSPPTSQRTLPVLVLKI